MGTMSFENPSSVEFTEDVYPVRLIMVGEMSVGKTCLVTKFVDPSFSAKISSATIELQLHEKKYTMNGKNIHLIVFDTAGMEKFRSLPRSYFRGAHAVMLVYDVTNRASFEKLDVWMKDIEKNARDNIVKLVVGNKADETNPRQVLHSQGREYAESQKAAFIETSATMGTAIEAAFEEVVSGALKVEEFWDTATATTNPSTQRGMSSPKKGSCCST